MNQEAIIYSPANLDSCLASAIVQLNAKKKGEELKVFAYSRGSDKFDLPSNFDKITILGADVSSDTLLELFESNKDTTIYENYLYQNSTVHTTKLLSEILLQNRYLEYKFEAEDGFKISVAGRIPSGSDDDSILYDKNKSSADNSVIRDYTGVVHKYNNFYPMTADETLFLYSNINGVRKAAAGLESLDIYKTDVGKHNSYWYDEYVQDIRRLVKANMSMAYYAGANGSGILTPTICVGERDAMLAMRFINYAHDDVISYEDTRSARIYRVLSLNNLNWYIKRFEPRDIWSEGFLTYFKTDLQQHVR